MVASAHKQGEACSVASHLATRLSCREAGLYSRARPPYSPVFAVQLRRRFSEVCQHQYSCGRAMPQGQLQRRGAGKALTSRWPTGSPAEGNDDVAMHLCPIRSRRSQGVHPPNQIDAIIPNLKAKDEQHISTATLL